MCCKIGNLQLFFINRKKTIDILFHGCIMVASSAFLETVSGPVTTGYRLNWGQPDGWGESLAPGSSGLEAQPASGREKPAEVPATPVMGKYRAASRMNRQNDVSRGAGNCRHAESPQRQGYGLAPAFGPCTPPLFAHDGTLPIRHPVPPG